MSNQNNKVEFTPAQQKRNRNIAIVLAGVIVGWLLVTMMLKPSACDCVDELVKYEYGSKSKKAKRCAKYYSGYYSAKGQCLGIN